MRTAFLTLALVSSLAQAQSVYHQGTLGGQIGVAVPKGQFADTWGRNMFSFGGLITLPSGRMPFQWGFDFNYASMGQKNTLVPVDSYQQQPASGHLAVSAKVLSYQPLLRFSPLSGKVRPYLDGLVGLRHFSTSSIITVDGPQEPVQQERLASNIALSAGWAAGLMVTMGKVGYIEGRVERITSGKASYVDPASITLAPQGTIGFGTPKSNTGNLNLLVGIGLRF